MWKINKYNSCPLRLPLKGRNWPHNWQKLFNRLNTRQHCILTHTLHYLLKETPFRFFLSRSNMIPPRHSNFIH